jgi:hypothetical protein
VDSGKEAGVAPAVLPHHRTYGSVYDSILETATSRASGRQTDGKLLHFFKRQTCRFHDITRAICILISYSVLFQETEEFHNRFRLYDENTSEAACRQSHGLMSLPLPVGGNISRQNRLPVKVDSGGLLFSVTVRTCSCLGRAFSHASRFSLAASRDTATQEKSSPSRSR